MEGLLRSWMVVCLAGAVAVLSGCTDDGDGDSGGSGNPHVRLYLGVPHSGTVASLGSKHFVFSTTMAGDYRVCVTDMDSNLAWYIASDSAFVEEFGGCDADPGTGDEIAMTGALEAGTDYYIEVCEQAGADATFTIAVYANEGHTPIRLALNVPYTATIEADGTREFVFTTVSSTNNYTISLTGLDSNLAWYTYQDEDFINLWYGCDNDSGAGDEISLRNYGGAPRDVWIQVVEQSGISGNFTITVTKS